MRNIETEYYSWLVSLVRKDGLSDRTRYDKLLSYLYDTEFVYLHPKDESRANDGIELRYRFSREQTPIIYNIYSHLDGPCSVLEMMVALAIRCEENIMDDPLVGNRLGQWFWGMVVSLGLGSMNDAAFDVDFVRQVITRFLNREYKPNGEGGLFTIANCDEDLRNTEIWYQLCWYLDCIV